MKRATSQNRIYAALFVLAIVGIASADNPTPVTACGTVITVAGKYALANDLVGCDQVGVAIQTSNVVLLLNGHTIAGESSGGGTGVAVGPPSLGATGVSNVTVTGPGVITNFTVIAGIAFVATSSSTVEGVTCTGNDFGFIIGSNSTNNIFKGNTVSGNRYGFGVYSGNNVLRGNDSSNNIIGFVVLGNGNEIRGNTANSNSQDGIQLAAVSTSNTFRGNTALGNNTSGGTFYDLEDDNAHCDSNLWQGNDFGTANQSCIQ
jgi:parallel beta-helix repeat protein